MSQNVCWLTRLRKRSAFRTNISELSTCCLDCYEKRTLLPLNSSNSQGLSLDGAREIVNKSGKRAGLVPALLEIADRVLSSSSLAGKEDPIVLVPDERQFIDRGVGRVADELDTAFSCRPCDGRRSMHVASGKTIGRIPQLEAVGCAQPVDVEGYRSLYGRSILQGIDYVMVVLYIEPADMQGTSSLSKMHVHAALRKGNRPEKTVFCNAGIKVVDLMCGVHRTLIDIESNKGKGVSVHSP